MGLFTQRLVLLLHLLNAAFFKSSWAVDHVVQLTEESIEKIINLPDSPFWLIVFYAPWCTHSKEFFPILSDVTPVVEGKMAIGKVDCSVDESLCEQHDINGYPTLKWYRNGSFHDYIRGREHDDILSFAMKMTSPIMSTIDDYDNLFQRSVLDQETNGATFVFYSSATDGSDSNENEALNQLLKVAREFQATNSFFHLETNVKNEHWIKAHASLSKYNGNILLKYEKDLKPTVFRSDWSSNSLKKFIDQNQEIMVPFVNQMNIGAYGFRNKYLAIAILDPTVLNSESLNFLSNFRQLAASCTQHISKHYQFVWINGKQWKDFLNKFSIPLQHSPQLFVLDYPNDIYWTDDSKQRASSKDDMERFLVDILEAKVLSTHLHSKHDSNIGKFERLMFIANNKWILNVQLALALLSLIMLIPQSAGRIHDFVETYVWRGCIDPILCHLGISTEKMESKKTD